jgi:Na+-transporting methylmalonyl-CoA/oxaloacetate decarboxylase gamma subunit
MLPGKPSRVADGNKTISIYQDDGFDWITGMVIAILGLMLIIMVILSIRKMERRKSPQQNIAEQWQEYRKKVYQR